MLYLQELQPLCNRSLIMGWAVWTIKRVLSKLCLQYIGNYHIIIATTSVAAATIGGMTFSPLRKALWGLHTKTRSPAGTQQCCSLTCNARPQTGLITITHYHIVVFQTLHAGVRFRIQQDSAPEVYSQVKHWADYLWAITEFFNWDFPAPPGQFRLVIVVK